MSNALWIIINVFCLLVTFHQLRRLDSEYRGSHTAEVSSAEVRVSITHDDLVTMMMQGPVSPRIRMYWAVSVVHAGCWLPLYCDTLIQWGRGTQAQGSTLSHEVILQHFLSQPLTIQTLI